jgi:acyl homoserine lactone synthase
MLRYVYASELDRFPGLKATMFKDRAQQFKQRLGWEVAVDENGEERDEYDAMNPLYVIWERADGTHGGSMRFLPTTGRTMVNDHFSHLTDGVHIESPFIWECTRFCLAPDAGREVAAGLVLGAGEIMKRFHLEHFVGVFDPRMERIYRMYGVEPMVKGTAGEGRDRIAVGLWEMQEAAWPKTLTRVGVDRETSANWWEQSMSNLPTTTSAPHPFDTPVAEIAMERALNKRAKPEPSAPASMIPPFLAAMAAPRASTLHG